MLVVPSGTNGTTSVAPMRGWTPRWTFRSISAARARQRGRRIQPLEPEYGNGQHHAVVHRVSVAVQNPRAVHLRRGRLDGVHDIRTRAFTEVGDALDQRPRRSVLCAAYHAGTALNHSDSSSILDLTLGEFLQRLGSSDPAPGGGAAAAVVGALGAALVEMTANLTLGRPRLADVEDQAQRIEQRASDLRSQLGHLGDADTEAFERVSAAYKLPRTDDAQKAARSRAIQAALRAAAEVPLEERPACAPRFSKWPKRPHRCSTRP